MGVIRLGDGRVLTAIHEEGTCFGEFCAIHRPSDHPLRDAPFDWFDEIRYLYRVCEHGFHHPDPDDIAFHQLIGDWATVEAVCSVHLMRENCDGCCQKRGDDD